MEEIGENTKEVKSYFSLAIPEEDAKITQDKPVVVTNLKDLLPLLKRNSHARFRSFTNYDDAVTFMKSPDSPQCNTPAREKPSIPRGRTSLPNTLRPVEKRSTNEEGGGTIYPNPKPQEFALLNTYITRKDNRKLLDAITSNPRLLCTDCDLAPAVHEGTKLNGLHAAAKSDNVEAAEMILSKISDIAFFQLLYPQDNSVIRIERCNHLNTSYLNTPDKMLLETPLHYAAKFNSIGVLKLLISHPLCILTPKNDQGMTPNEIAGSRYRGENAATKRSEVLQLLNDTYIVPLWRDVFSSSTRVGLYGPWRSFGRSIPKFFLGPFSKLPEEMLGKCDEELLPAPHSGEVATITSYAGPMSKDQALEFYCVLKSSTGRRIAENPYSPCRSPGPSPISKGLSTPPPTPSPVKILASSPIYSTKDLVLPVTPTKSMSHQSKADMTLRMEDGVKGLERLCRKYAKVYDIQWTEYWPFLEAFCNLESSKGLTLLEKYLMEKESLQDLRVQEQCDELDIQDLEQPNGLFSQHTPCRKNLYVAEKVRKSTKLEFNEDPDSVSDLVQEFLKLKLLSSSSNTSVPEQCSTNWQRSSVIGNEYKNIEGSWVKNSNLEEFRIGQLISTPGQESSVQMNINRLWDYRDVLDESIASANGSMDTDSCDVTLSEYSKEDCLDDHNDFDVESFTTAASYEDREEDFEDCISCSVFINGERPSDKDRQVLHALKDVLNEDSLYEYPAISRWYNSIVASGFLKSCPTFDPERI